MKVRKITELLSIILLLLVVCGECGGPECSPWNGIKVTPVEVPTLRIISQ